jgi:hypothetical protein
MGRRILGHPAEMRTLMLGRDKSPVRNNQIVFYSVLSVVALALL